jgi:hypothetical protein
MAALAIAAFAAPLAANTAPRPSTAAQTPPAAGIARFTPAPDAINHTIDYRHWDEALGHFVIPMGPSIRDGAQRPESRLGTRINYGQRSRFRLEGNRVAFSYFDNGIRQGLSEYRRDLEAVGSSLDLTSLPRNEQLAYWLNLHNVAIIEALARQYPSRDPTEHAFGANGAALHDAKLVTVKGVPLSPRDIRERIVYINWQDPKVIYGFWHGMIGGPSLQRLAFTGANVDLLLSLAAEEFVNSLRGVEAYRGKLQVSALYKEAAPFYFASGDKLREHLSAFTRAEVRELVERYETIAYAPFETAIADLTFGKGDPALNFVCGGEGGAVGALPLALNPTLCTDEATRPNPAIARLMRERAVKLQRAARQDIRTGTVVFGDAIAQGDPPREVN